MDGDVPSKYQWKEKHYIYMHLVGEGVWCFSTDLIFRKLIKLD